MTTRRRPCPATVAVLLIASAAGGCATLETEYGRSGDLSVNGTGVLARVLRGRGHAVRATRRLDDRTGRWADTIVRFADRPGPPDRREGAWLRDWLAGDSARKVVYVPRDFDAAPEYWSTVLEQLPASVDPGRRRIIENERNRVRNWTARLPKATTEPAGASDWFAVEASIEPSPVASLAGPWAEGVDAKAAALTRRQMLKVDGERVLLTADGKTMAMDFEPIGGGSVLVVANACFLLNEPIARAARRPLLTRFVDWIGDDASAVALVEGSIAWDAAQGPPSMLDLLRIEPMGWIGGHIIALGVVAAVAAAARLGRPRPDAPSDAQRPAAHAEALGDLLAKTRDAASASAEVRRYRDWRSAAEVGRRAREPT